MKKLLVLSVVLNVLLAGGLLWLHRSQEEDLLRFYEMAWDGDRRHVELHARSLSALESGDAAEIEEVEVVLRAIVRAGESNEELREALRGAWGRER